MTNLLVHTAFGYSAVDPAAVWTDISPYADVARGAVIDHGASDEVSRIQTGTLILALDNSDGRFTPGRPASPYYPNVGKGTPVRVAVAVLDTPTGTAPYPLAKLSDNFDDNKVNTTLWSGNFGGATEAGGLARVPAAAGVTAGYLSARQWTLTGSQSTVHLVTVPSPTGASSATCTFMVNAVTSGTRVGFIVNSVANTISFRSEVGFSDGAAVTITYSPTAHAWLRIREASGTVAWETSPDGVTWTVRRTLATPAWVGTDQVSLQMAATRNAGSTDYAEYDLVGATVHPRFYGTVTSWPTTFQGLLATASLTASDLFAWLSRRPALQPMLVEEVLQDGPQAYYPLSEPQGSTSGGDLSGYTRPSLATVQAGSGGTLTFGSGTGPPSDALRAPYFAPASSSAGKYLTADLGTRLTTESSPGSYVFEAWFAAAAITGRVIMSWATSDPPAFENSITFLLDSATGHLQIEKRTGGALTTTTLATPDLSDGAAHHVVFDEASGTVWVDGTSYSVTIDPSIELRLLTVGAYSGNRLWGGTISHVAVYVNTGSGPTGATVASHYTPGTTGAAGETAAQRIARLAGYAGVGTITAGTFSAVGSQGDLGRTVLSHMQDIETTESGKLFCDRGTPAVVFQGRTVRYNPISVLSIAFADTESSEAQFSDDDQKLVNQVVASRPGGATQRVVNAASVNQYGPYEKPLDILKTSDNEVLDAANWTVIRYADPPPELRQLPVEAYSMGATAYRALLDADISTVVTVTGLPDTAPTTTATVTVEGYRETIKERYHLLDFHTSRADTDAVWALDDPTYSVLGSTTRLAY